MATGPAALKDIEQAITEDINCVICQEDYDNPKALPCCHVYCLACLEKLVSQARRTDRHCDSIVCPTCRKVAKIPTEAEGGAAGFPTSFHVNKMMEIRAKVQKTVTSTSASTAANGDVTACFHGIGAKPRPALRFRGEHVRSITANLYRPWGLAVDKSTRLIVIDNGGWLGGWKCVHVFNTHDGSALESFVDSAYYWTWPIKYAMGVGQGYCDEPRGVAIDRRGNVLVVDGKGHRIQQFTSSGTFLRSAGSYGNGNLQFNDPVGIAVHPHTNEVYVCDRRNNRIQVLSENLSYILSFGMVGSQSTALHYPWDVDFDSCGNIYVADCGNCCIKVYSPQWHYLRSIGRQGTRNGEFQHVSSICIDKDDFVYATDKEKNCVSIFNPQGEFVMQFGHPGAEKGEMYYPLGMAVDEDGFVYVSDSYNQRVQVFQ